MVGIPVGDDNSGRHRFPIVTVLLIAANALVFYLELLGGEEFIIKWAFVPARLNENPAGEAVTALTAMFLHGGWAHLIGNMLYLWVFGDNVEDRLGRLRFLLFYLASGVIATASQYATFSAPIL
jgi:membrane associated rhomboid family serine protease